VRWSFWGVAALIVILPSSSVFPASDVAADRRMYLPLCFLAIAVPPLFDRLRRPAWVLAVAILCAISIRYSLVWRTEESLWTEAVEHAPRKVRPRIHLARAVEPQPALALLREAETVAPADPAVASEEGRIYLTTGRAPEALSAFGRALALDPDNADAIQNRGVALLALGQTAPAVADFRRALERDPCHFQARVNLERAGVAPGPVPSSCRFTPDQIKQLR
jgi:tetratricopeptide (TPR) repeat protein